MSPRTTLALPIDIFIDHFDSTVTQTQLTNNILLGSEDDRDVLASMLEGAEDEFRQQASLDVRLSRVGSPGDRTTYEQVTYEVPGHENYKRQWSRVGGDYLNQEVEKDLKHDRVLPFDSSEGDEAFLYRGVSGAASGQWDDVTADQGRLWDIVDHRSGTLVFHPVEVDRAMLAGAAGVGISRGRLRELRFAITYRHGALGGGRGVAGGTTLTEALTASGTPNALGVDDASRLPASDGVTLLLDGEYIEADVDASTDTLDVLQRGIRNTTGAAHSSGDVVVYTPPSVRKAVAARAGMQVVQAGRYQSWLPDSDDAIDKDAMLEEFRGTWNSTLEAMS